MTAKVILNPYAARWQALARRAEVEAALHAAGIAFEMALTEGPGHGIELAAQAVRDGFSPLIAAGGDGTISEVVNGMAGARPDGAVLGPLGILPLGSANDLVINLGLPRDLTGAAQVIAAGKMRRIDLGQITYITSDRGQRSRYFDNNSAIGLEPHVTLLQQRITWLHGAFRYLVATFWGVMQLPQWNMHIEWEGGQYTGPVTLLTVGNGPLTGGLFYMAPHADMANGKFTFVHGYLPGRWQIFRILPHTMKPGAGSYVEHPNVHEFHTPWLRIHVDPSTPLHADGEIQSQTVQDIEYRMLPAKLDVLVK